MPGTGQSIGVRVWWPVVATTLAFVGLFLMPGDELQTDSWWAVWHMDKVLHATAFAFWGLTLSIAWAKQRLYPGRAFAIRLIGLGVIFGTVLEVVQGAWMAGRTADPWDLVADVAGTAFALGLFKWIFGRWPGRIAAD